MNVVSTGNGQIKTVRQHFRIGLSTTWTMDVDNKTELIDGATLDPNSAIIEPMDQTAAAAKAANATKHF